MMKVKLISCPSPADFSPELASAICVGKEGNHPKLGAALSEESVETLGKGLTHAVNAGHLGVLEHLSFTWYAEGLSRACTHQLVRHRIASYNQQSQRYCKINTDEDWYVVPDSIAENTAAKELYYRAMNGVATIYKELVKGGIPKEDARMVLPNACKTKIVITMNARAFIEASEKRLCNRAQWEIRELFMLMRKEVFQVYPLIATLAKPRCMKKGCIEAKPCGKPWVESFTGSTHH